MLHRVTGLTSMQLWSGSMDGKVYVYDSDEQGAVENQRALTHDSLRSGVRCLAHSGGNCPILREQSGKSRVLVVAGAEDGRVAIWNAATETCLASVAAHSNIVSALCAMGDLVCCSSCTNCRNLTSESTDIFLLI